MNDNKPDGFKAYCAVLLAIIIGGVSLCLAGSVLIDYIEGNPPQPRVATMHYRDGSTELVLKGTYVALDNGVVRFDNGSIRYDVVKIIYKDVNDGNTQP